MKESPWILIQWFKKLSEDSFQITQVNDRHSPFLREQEGGAPTANLLKGKQSLRLNLLGINPAVWAAGSELGTCMRAAGEFSGACVRGRASSAAVRACARPLGVWVASCSDGREDRGCGVSRFPASCASWRVVASGRIVQRVRGDVE